MGAPLLAALWEQPLAEGPARDANRILADARLRMELRHGWAEGYEVNLPANPTAPWLGELAAKLAYHIRCKGQRAPRCPGLFLGLFVNLERLVCVEASDFFAHLHTLEGWSDTTFRQKLSEWEKGAP